MISRFVLPKPISDDSHIFEDLVCDIMARRLHCENLQRYGRRGQAQQGIDIAGFTAGLTRQGVIGIQCKHHPTTIISVTEIDKEIAASEKFQPGLAVYYIVTSSDRDTEPDKHVMARSQQREAEGKYPVYIKFWDELIGWLADYPDLVYKYFSQFFPLRELESIRLVTSQEALKETVIWPAEPEELKKAIALTQHGVQIVSPYKLSIGVSSFAKTRFDQLVDLQLLLTEYFQDEQNAEASFDELAVLLHEVRVLLDDPFYSREVWLYLNVRLSLAYLIGWIFRRVTSAIQLTLKLIVGGQIWATEDLPVVAASLTDSIPYMLNPESTEIAVVLNITRETHTQVQRYVKSWGNPPLAVFAWDLDGHEVRSAAHALALAKEISRKLKNLMDKGNITHIHLFGAVPAALATLICYDLNAIHPISLYFMDKSRTDYQCGGTLHNQL